MMRWIVATVACLSVLIVTSSCSLSDESRGDKAYKAAQKSSGEQKRLMQKRAYIFYQKAVKANPDKINNRLRNRYVEMILNRANMVMTEGSADMDALPLFMRDLDVLITADVQPTLRDSYAALLGQKADSLLDRQKLNAGLALLDKAVKVAANPGPFAEKRKNIAENFAGSNVEMGRMEFEESKKNKDPKAAILAEYHVLLGMLQNPNIAGAAELLSQIRQANTASYSAYEAVVDDRPDTSLYKQVNKYDILMAIPTIGRNGNQVSMTVTIFNYSYNPLRLKPADFFIVDDNGNQSPALAGSKIEKEILDQEHEGKMTLVFNAVPGKIKKLMYKTEGHLSEKFLF